MTDADRVIADAIAAHGGASLWQRLDAIEAVLSADGFLFASKRVRPLPFPTLVAIDIHELQPLPASN